MARWTKATSDPITVEREVRVQCLDDDREGYVRVARTGTSPSLIPFVYAKECHYDKDGCEVEEPTITALDKYPTLV